jgi:hypothetical protein
MNRTLGQTRQLPDQCLGFDDAGRRRPDRGHTCDVRLESTEERPVDNLQIIDPVLVTLGSERFETRNLFGGGRHNQFTATIVRDTVVPAETIETLASVDTQTRLE